MLQNINDQKSFQYINCLARRFLYYIKTIWMYNGDANIRTHIIMLNPKTDNIGENNYRKLSLLYSPFPRWLRWRLTRPSCTSRPQALFRSCPRRPWPRVTRGCPRSRRGSLCCLTAALRTRQTRGRPTPSGQRGRHGGWKDILLFQGSIDIVIVRNLKNLVSGANPNPLKKIETLNSHKPPKSK